MPTLQQLLKLFIIICTITSSEAFAASRCIIPTNSRPSAFIGQCKSRTFFRSSSLYSDRSHSSELDSAYEWLAESRAQNEPSIHGKIKWFSPDTTTISDSNIDDVEIKRVPLYPLGAVHVPHSGENHTIINIEPKNVKMAMDLKNGKWEDALFCASLRARDTNRIASVGTIMQLLDTDDRSIIGAKTWPGDELTLNRVVAKCRAVGVAEILWIEECDYGEDDYLIANVRIYNDKETTSTVNERSDEFDSIAQQIIDDYQKVRSIYINSQSLASNELPKFARNSVQTLPTFDHEIVHNEMKIWMLVETWQMLCNTIRQSKRSRLQAVVNELSVAAAMQAKGPLELPVKRNSLPLDLQKQLDDLEQNASREYLELGMEPVLDFQEIICMKRHVDRVMKLASMIQRERLRLEAKESLIQAFLEMELGEELMSGNYSRDSGKNAFD